MAGFFLFVSIEIKREKIMGIFHRNAKRHFTKETK